MTETRLTASAPPERPAASAGRGAGSFRFCGSPFSSSPRGSSGTWRDIGTAGPAPPVSKRPTTPTSPGDVTPLSAKVSGYVANVAVNDFQTVRKGDLIVDDRSLRLSRRSSRWLEANLAAAQATLANLANQRDVQHALIRQAEATIDATEADVLRYQLEAKRQRDLFADPHRRHAAAGRAGRRQRQAARRRSCS